MKNTGIPQFTCDASECHVTVPLTSYPPESGKHTNHLEAGYNCGNCHMEYLDRIVHKNGILDGNMDNNGNNTIIVYFDSLNPSAIWDNSTADCSNMSCHGDANWYSPEEPGCTLCHYPGNTTGAVDPMTTNGSGTDGRHVKHVTERGFPCEKCHSDYKAADTHGNGILDTDDSSINIIVFDSLNPSGTWTGDTGPGTGKCSSLACHGPSSPEWYGTGTWSLPACTACHSSTVGTRRQVLGPGGDFSLESHHVIDYADRNSQIVMKSDCLVCHDNTEHMGGSVRLNNKDNAGQIIVYDPSDASGLEPFCLSCHDSDGALTETGSEFSPFTSSNILGVIPNTAGTEIKSYWNNTYTVHKDNGITCAGTGEIGTGCHGNNGSINMHGSSARGILAKNLALPTPDMNSDPTPRNPGNQAYVDYINNIFRLCFDCHENYTGVTKEVVLGYKSGGNYDLSWAPTAYYTSGIMTLFREVYTGGPEIYDDFLAFADPNIPLHNYHILTTDVTFNNQNVWAYRGDSGQTGRAGCTTCHNVHGTSATVSSTYQEFGITAFSNGPDLYKTFVPDTNFSDTVMKNYPVFCNANCHSIGGPTYYWHTPSNE